jgi:hypothetical protein
VTRITKTKPSRSDRFQIQLDRRARIDAARVQCEAWNEANPVGVNVVFRGEHTHTIGRAMVGLHGEACVFVAVRIGAVLIGDCEVVR